MTEERPEQVTQDSTQTPSVDPCPDTDALVERAELDRQVADAQREVAEHQRRVSEQQREVASKLREAIAAAKEQEPRR
ncbi:hypothetical protein CCAX7_15490 [Capsulimonas corticalis]|uniref:Uncharacterized protein n=1 Tax=Capsulimonas corticalis TaxID=2219043 RepID=A0A402CZ93_9BACT|nr:hypothetical protein [Capsulimonas corticalis]BDI29498.1 hypothetical protein CCAX7_15490 [Capsulimonas corticalis]